MQQVISLNIEGIKCDNPNCDFLDKTVENLKIIKHG